MAYCAEEYVAAESLDVAMRHYAPAPIATVLPFITQLAGAIDFARAAGVGHGALHPRDIFVTPEEARATGFGVVEALERVGLRAPVRRPYSPPERIAGQPWDTHRGRVLPGRHHLRAVDRPPARRARHGNRHAHGGNAEHLDGRAARGARARDGCRPCGALSDRARVRRRARGRRTGRARRWSRAPSSPRRSSRRRLRLAAATVPPARRACAGATAADPRTRATRCRRPADQRDQPRRRHRRRARRRRGGGPAADRGSGGGAGRRDVHRSRRRHRRRSRSRSLRGRRFPARCRRRGERVCPSRRRWIRCAPRTSRSTRPSTRASTRARSKTTR